MKKTIEEAAEEYLLNGLLCINEDEGYSNIDIEEAFLSGHAYALEQAQEGHTEWHYKLFRDKGIDMGSGYGLDAWIASRLSAQKEIAHLKMISAEHSRAMDSESDALKKIFELEEKLNQQRFNNEHNLSIDQKVSDRIIELEAKLKVAVEALEYAHAIFESHEEVIGYNYQVDMELALETIRGEK